jgi:hypothetical protein
MRSTDGHRSDPLGAAAGHRHPGARHLMTIQRRPDRRLRERGRSRVRSRVPRSVIPVGHVRRRTRTLDVRRAGRRRSRADGTSIDDASRSTIPLPAP